MWASYVAGLRSRWPRRLSSSFAQAARGAFLLGVRNLVTWLTPMALQVLRCGCRATGSPVNDRIEVGSQLVDIPIESARCHVSIHTKTLRGCHPLQRSFQNFLALHITLGKCFPFWQLSVTSSTSLLLCGAVIDKLAGDMHHLIRGDFTTFCII